MATQNSIVLTSGYRKIQSCEIATGQTIKPGMLLELVTDTTTVQVHGTAGGDTERFIAVEDALQGDIKTDTYTAGNIVDAVIMEPGHESQVLVASGQDIAFGDFLESAGNGKFRELTTGKALCRALEAADLNDSGDVDTLVHVRWL